MPEVKIAVIPIGDRSVEESANLPIKRFWQELKLAVDNEMTAEGLNPGSDGPSQDFKEQILEIADAFDSGPLTRASNEEGISVQLDWAMQIRQATSYDWATCLYVAGVFFYG